MSNLKESFPSILISLSIIDESDKSAAGQKACSLLKAIQDFEFLFIVYSMHEIFEITSILNKSLQMVKIDLIVAETLVLSTVSSLQNLRNRDHLKSFIQTVFPYVKTTESRNRKKRLIN